LEAQVVETALNYARQQCQATVESLLEFLRIPSVSTLPEHEPDMQQAADWLAATLRRIGMTRVEILSTPGHPVVYGEWLDAGEGAPTLLGYGHYDVQPVDPVEEWHTPPFEPTIRGDDLVARGASDDKGQLLAVVAAAEAYLRGEGRLPLNLKLMFEGEEEIASPHMAGFLRDHRQRLAADVVFICDSDILTPDQPLITYGVRGLTYMEVEVRGPETDVHSGSFGGVIDNPFNVLVRLLAQLQDAATGRILIPGFYDRVRPIDDEERALLAQVPFDEARVRELTGVPGVAGEIGYTLVERRGVRPTLDIHGLPGGFTGPGKKTVIPARAWAKVSMRLVPDQDPEEIARLFEAHMHTLAPPTVEVKVRTLGTARPAYVDPQSPAVQAAARAYELAFGALPVYVRGGGTLPIVADFQDTLGAPVVLMGLGLPDDGAHAPNEKFYLPNLYRGVESLIHYYALLAEGPEGGR
jgi:acetylornithine deacetylase/succinyl-diaminopimelate desuccinylase-like protein